MKSLTKSLILVFSTLMLLTGTTLFGAGEVHNDKVSTYLRGGYIDVSTAESKLTAGGFEVLGKDQITSELTSIAFTCPALKKMANKPKRGFAATLHLLVNKKDNEIAVTNPLYFGKAFLQKDFDEAGAQKVLSKINAAFPGLKDSDDSMSYDDLAGYHFTFGMPYYEDMERVGKGPHEVLVEKAKSKNPVFVLQLDAQRTLIGFKLTPKTAKFVKKIGTKNAALLPYSVLIEGDAAYILAPKYYIALSYPLLKMTQFMRIATVPGKITKEAENLFK